MPDEQKPKERKKKPDAPETIEPETEGSILASAAKAIGTAAGKIASLAGVAPAPSRPKVKKPKLQKKNKSRMPRRQKKAHQKAAARQL